MTFLQASQYLVVGLVLVSAASANYVPYPTRKDICLFGCYDWTDHITFALPADLAASENYYEPLCLGRLKYGSIFACSQVYCTDEELRSGVALLNRTCQVEANLNLPSFDNLTLTAAELDEDVISIPDLEWVSLSWKTDTAFYTNIWWSFDFSYAFYGYWALVILVGILYRCSEFLTYHSSRESSWWTWIRRRILLPATFGRHCQEPVLGSTIPPRIETLTIGLFVLMNFIMCFPGYDIFDNNQYFETKAIQLSRYVADRTGILSIALVPLLWVFSARNDPLLWLTGWSFATFNRFHRWLARLSFIHAVIHSAAYTINYRCYPDEYETSWKEPYFYYGQAATIVMALSVGFSIHIVRDKVYDTFLLVHIIFAVLFLVFLWFHVEIEFYDQYLPFLWPCVAIWVLDRVLRIARLLYSSVIPRYTKGVRAIATYDKRSQMTRLDVTDFFNRNQIVMPGYYYYVYFGSAKAYESHPFTLFSWHRANPTHERVDEPMEAKTEFGNDEPRRNVSVVSVEERHPNAELCHSFLIRPYNGFTNRLLKRITSSEERGASANMTVFIEGPYGNPVDLTPYSDVLLIAGGSGITAAVSHTYHLSTNSNSTQIYLAWAVPQRHLVDDVVKNELAAIVTNPNFHMQVYLTSDAEKEGEKPVAVPPYVVHFGRPDIFAVMREARQNCKRDLAVVTCGTPAMADACRESMVRLLGEKGPKVAYYNETMLW